VRETLFNWLQLKVAGARCLDLFSGSGVLGLEALSRGAAYSCMVDQSAPAVRQIHQHLARLGADQARVIRANSYRWLQENRLTTCQPDKQQPSVFFDIVFIDPPFRQGLVSPCCRCLQAYDWLAKEAIIYIEAEAELKPLLVPSSWQLIKSKQAGQLNYYLYQAP
jgi:16S rRNA (guanine966-N2)-methyltransferase